MRNRTDVAAEIEGAMPSAAPAGLAARAGRMSRAEIFRAVTENERWFDPPELKVQRL